LDAGKKGEVEAMMKIHDDDEHKALEIILVDVVSSDIWIRIKRNVTM
jgi:hypothetical protein